MMGVKNLKSILGKRPGEVISCVHADEEEGGCGTSMACVYCGAVNAMLESQKTGMKAVKETRISTLVDGKQKSLDLNITSSPVTLSGQVFYALIFQDISDQKRRLALEKIFFHDLLNSAGGLNGLLTLLKDGTAPDSERELIDLSEEASRDIVEELLMHKQIRSAEMGDLQIHLEKVHSHEIIHSAIGRISSHEAGKDKKIILDDNFLDFEFETDRIIMQRVIINMLKNALEATSVDGIVLTGAELSGRKGTILG